MNWRLSSKGKRQSFPRTAIPSSIPQGYAQYHVWFGAHVTDSYFDDLRISFNENWDDGLIDPDMWNFVDNVVPSHGGHKASIVDGELFINAYNDWTQGCGIISKIGFPNNTVLNLQYRVGVVRVANAFQGIMFLMDSGELSADGYNTGRYLMELGCGNDNIRDLFVLDAEGTKYPLGYYVPGQTYDLQIVFGISDTRVTTNGATVTIPHAYPVYHPMFGGHVEDSYFDNLSVSPLIGESNVATKVAYVSDETGDAEIYVLSLDRI